MVRRHQPLHVRLANLVRRANFALRWRGRTLDRQAAALLASDTINAYERKVSSQNGEDGILAEILYTSFGMVAMNIKDIDLAMACLRVFNDYAAEFCSYNPNRLIGIGAVVPDDVDRAVKEFEHIRKLGLRGAMMPVTLAVGESYADPKYDKIWAAAHDLDLVLTFHAGTSRAGINPKRADWAQLFMSGPYLWQRTL